MRISVKGFSLSYTYTSFSIFECEAVLNTQMFYFFSPILYQPTYLPTYQFPCEIVCCERDENVSVYVGIYTGLREGGCICLWIKRKWWGPFVC